MAYCFIACVSYVVLSIMSCYIVVTAPFETFNYDRSCNA